MPEKPTDRPLLVVNSVAVPLFLVAAILIAGVIWAAGDIITLFLVCFFLAYIFNPLANRLTRRGLPRWAAALLITAAMVIVVLGMVAAVGPVLYEQAKELLQSLRGVATSLAARIDEILGQYVPTMRDNGLSAMLRRPEQPVQNLAGPIAARVVSGGLAAASVIGLALLGPMILFYLIKDWPVMAARAFDAVPAHRRESVRALAAQMHRVLSAFLHGQAWVCAIDAVLYAIGLTIVGVNYAIVIGLIAGVFKFLPYIGTVLGALLAAGVALSQAGWDAWLMAGIAATFIFVEVVENVTYPRIVGDRVRLPPVLVIFAVLLGGKLMGVLGVFIAVPAFAVARVALNFWFGDRQAPAPESPAPLPHTPLRRPKRAS